MRILLLFCFCCYSAAAWAQEIELKKKPSLYTILLENPEVPHPHSVSEVEVSAWQWLQLLRSAVAGHEDLTIQEGLEQLGYASPYLFFKAMQPQISALKPEIAPFFMGLDTVTELNEQLKLTLEKKSDELLKSKWQAVPITGISWEQATAFCGWRTFLANEGISSEAFFYDNRLEKTISVYKVVFRLPTEAEFDYWLMGERLGLRPKNEIPALIDSIRGYQKYPAIDSMNVKGCILWNFQIDKHCESAEELHKKYGKGVVPSATATFPSYWGIYDMLGNVAEMTATKGVAKGGSYAHYAFQCLPLQQQLYDSPQPWLGFRYVIDFIPLE